MDRIIEEAFRVAGGGYLGKVNKESIDCPNTVEIETAPDASDAIEIISKAHVEGGLTIIIFRDKETKKEYILAQNGESVALTPRLD